METPVQQTARCLLANPTFDLMSPQERHEEATAILRAIAGSTPADAEAAVAAAMAATAHTGTPLADLPPETVSVTRPDYEAGVWRERPLVIRRPAPTTGLAPSAPPAKAPPPRPAARAAPADGLVSQFMDLANMKAADLGDLLGRSRQAVDFYAKGRTPFAPTRPQLRAMREILAGRRTAIDGLIARIEDIERTLPVDQ